MCVALVAGGSAHTGLAAYSNPKIPDQRLSAASPAKAAPKACAYSMLLGAGWL
jgi:hypothetical protein